MLVNDTVETLTHIFPGRIKLYNIFIVCYVA